jgi:secondary thiamine-phosphate synthase enzyme
MIRKPYELIIPLSEYQEVLSPEGYAIIDITDEVELCILDSRVKTGKINIHTCHTTCGVGVQEYERGLAENDFLNMFRFVAPIAAEYDHNDLPLRAKQPDPKLDCGNVECLDAHAHILALLLPQNITRNIENGKMVLGKWPNILFLELNGHGRDERTLSIHISGTPDEIIKTTLVYEKRK